MKVLVACEHSGVVRDAFLRQGVDAWSCDLLPSESSFSSNHLQCDVREVMTPDNHWDIIIAHPDCTYLCGSASWLFKEKQTVVLDEGTLYGKARQQARKDALKFVRLFLDYEHCNHICVENPVGAIGFCIRKADQYVQPYDFGDDASKKTGLWLKGLPNLVPTKYVEPRIVGVMKRWSNQTDSGNIRRGPSKDRWKNNAKTYKGIAEAMAIQWTKHLKEIKND